MIYKNGGEFIADHTLWIIWDGAGLVIFVFNETVLNVRHDRSKYFDNILIWQFAGIPVD